jgi:outer membrane receptor protein involved in Fe transport
VASRSTKFVLVALLFIATAGGKAESAPGQGPTGVGEDGRQVSGIVLDDRQLAVDGAIVQADGAFGQRTATTDSQGAFSLHLPLSPVRLSVRGRFIAGNELILPLNADAQNLQLKIHYEIPPTEETLVITASVADPTIERRNDTIYKNTLFLRDDQLFETLDGGINAGQHEGGGKSLEFRRFGFNLDHGGQNGGLKVLVDDVPQNQATQGHGQGYLGSLKELTPELVGDVDIISGPFSAEYGDFSALGVVHIRTKESLDNAFTLRAQGGSFDGYRTFVAWSPRARSSDSFIAWEHAYTNGPFLNPLRYVRDNFTGNFTRKLGSSQALGLRFVAGRNDFDSSGQIPLDLVYSGALDRFGYMDPGDGGAVRNGTGSVYYRKNLGPTDTFRVDGFLTRSLFDLFSDFTFYLNDPVNGDGIQQHDSRLQEGGSSQYIHAQSLRGHPALFTAGANLTDNWVSVDLFHVHDRQIVPPVSGNPWTEANVHILNPAAYVQQGIDFTHLHVDAGLRFDAFRFAATDRLVPANSGIHLAASFEPKVNIVYTPDLRVPIALHFNYGRAVTSQDARGMALDPTAPKAAATNFYMVGTSHQLKRFSASADAFLIDRQHEDVYDPDNGSLHYQGPSRSYGWEAKASWQIAQHLSWNAGLAQVGNAFFLGTAPREYVDSAPHTVANSSLTLNGWHGLFSSFRYRHIGSYLLVNPDDTSMPPAPPFTDSAQTRASGLDVLDFAATKKLMHGLEWNLSIDNVNNKRYYETQNFFDSRVTPAAPVEARVHGTPGYPVGFTTGLTWSFE